MKLYSFNVKGVNQKTNRRKTIKLKAVSQDAAIRLAIIQGLNEPFECIQQLSEQPTDSQLKYATDLGIILPSDVDKDDLKQLIENKLIGDSYAGNPDLIDFANCHSIGFSKYIGKKALYDLVFESLKVEDKIAFFIFCVYRDISNDRRGNLEVHPDKQKFYDFAFQIFDNEKIVKSINKYTGRQIRYFEFTNEKGNTYYNGNTSSDAYKAAMTYLEAAFNLDEIKKIHISNQPTKSNSSSYKDPIGYRGVTLNTKQKITNEYQNEVKKAHELSRKTKNSNSGCSLILILSIIVIITLTYCFFSL